MKKWIIIIICVLFIAGIALRIKSSGNGPEADTEEKSYAEVTKGTISKEVSTTGLVEPNEEVEIKCEASGEIISIYYDISDAVKEGDLLVELDPEDEQRNVEQAQVSLNSSKARLKQAELEYTQNETQLKHNEIKLQAEIVSAQSLATDRRSKESRMKNLYEQQTVSKENWESSETEAIQAETSLTKAKIALDDLEIDRQQLKIQKETIILAQLQVKTDEIELDDMQQRLEDTKVYAPMNGVISDRLVQVGSIISSPTNNVSGGSTLMSIADLSKIYVLASVDESDIGKIQVGQRVIATVDSYADKSFHGFVRRIATKGSSTSSVVTFEVKIEIKDKNKNLLKPGMTSSITVIVDKHEQALLLPTEAVQYEGTKTYVYQERDGKKEKTEVTTGLSDGFKTEILQPLKTGDEVLIVDGTTSSKWSNKNSSQKKGSSDTRNQRRILRRMK